MRDRPLQGVGDPEIGVQHVTRITVQLTRPQRAAVEAAVDAAHVTSSLWVKRVAVKMAECTRPGVRRDRPVSASGDERDLTAWPVPPPGPAVDPAVTALRHLAVAVLGQAVADTRNPHLPAA